MRTIILLSTLLLASVSQAAVVKSFDHENHCTLYQAVAEQENGDVILTTGQTIFSKKRVYGLSFVEMEIDFDKREVSVVPTMNVVLGVNRPLFESKVVIREENPEFTFLINQLNRRLFLFEKMCINSSSEVVYAKYFPQEETQSK